MRQSIARPAGAGEGRPVAVVTGASEGFGRELASRIARDGYDLVIVARNRARLAELAAQLEGECGAGVEVQSFDLTRPGQQLALAELVREQPNLKLLVNNAAFSVVGEFAALATEKLQQMASLNFTAVCALSQAALQNADFCRGGTVLNVGSIGGTYPMPLDATYSATKAALDIFSKALAYEVAHDHTRDVKVQVAKLGGLNTAWNDRTMGPMREGAQPDRRMEAVRNEPAAAADAIWRQCKARKRSILYDCRRVRVQQAVFSLLPWLGSRLVYTFYSEECRRRG